MNRIVHVFVLMLKTAHLVVKLSYVMSWLIVSLVVDISKLQDLTTKAS